MVKSKYEVGSCLHRVHKKQSMQLHDMCAKCKELDRKPKSFFQGKRDPYYNQCLNLHDHGGSEVPREVTNQDHRPKRSSKATDINRFTACPAGGKHHMQTDREQPHEVEALRRARARKKSLEGKENLTHRERKQILHEFTGDPGLSLPQNGHSRAADARIKETFASGLNEVGKLMFPDHPTVERIRIVKHLASRVTPRRLGGDQCVAMETPSTEEYKLARMAPIREREIDGTTTDDEMEPAVESPIQLIAAACNANSPVVRTGPTEGLDCEGNDSTIGIKRSALQSGHEATATATDKKPKLGKVAQKHKEMVEKAKFLLGSSILEALTSHPKFKKPKAARHLLACLGNGEITRRAAEEATGRNISPNQWNEIKIHCRHPGPLVPIEPKAIYRQRISSDILTMLLTYLNSSAVTQRYAYGNKLQALDSGGTANLDNVTLRTSIQQATESFLIELYEGFEKYLESVQDLPPDEMRCEVLETAERARRCLKSLKPDGSKHDGKCKFTPVGSVCRSSIRKLNESLTGNEIKALAALDDVKVMKGRENWEQAKRIVENLLGKDTEEAEAMNARITLQETYYYTDFVPHLFQVSNNKCNCLTCGFCEEAKTTRRLIVV